MQQMTRYWLNWYPILMQVNRECFTNYFYSSKETQIWTNLQILDRFPPVGRPVTCSNDPAKVPAFSTETLYRSSKNRSVSLLSFSLFFSYALTRTVAHWTRIPVTKRRNRRGRMPGITPRGWPFQLSTFPPGVRIPPTHALDDPCKASLSPKGSPGSPL